MANLHCVSESLNVELFAPLCRIWLEILTFTILTVNGEEEKKQGNQPLGQLQKVAGRICILFLLPQSRQVSEVTQGNTQAFK